MSAAPREFESNTSAFLAALRHALTSVFFLVIGGTYIGIGALAHDFGFSEWWLTASTLIVWAGPAQVILISALGAGTTLIEVAIAVSLSGIRLLPMVMSLLPQLRDERRRLARLLLPAHFTSVSMWVEAHRVLSDIPRQHRVAYVNGLSIGYMGTAVVFGLVGFYLAAGLPPLLAGALLFVTPMSFLITTVRNSRAMIENLAFILGLVVGPVLTYYHVGLDLLWTGVIGGVIAYAAHRLRESLT